MVRLNIHEAKTYLSVCLKRVAKGESILLCNRNTPVAEIRPLPAPRKTKRPLGLAKGAFKVPEEFFKPVSASVIKAFRG
jgi:antitoxin (DNA-binding transcriptional repressor) of toxin-antitoxin stability system